MGGIGFEKLGISTVEFTKDEITVQQGNACRDVIDDRFVELLFPDQGPFHLFSFPKCGIQIGLYEVDPVKHGLEGMGRIYGFFGGGFFSLPIDGS